MSINKAHPMLRWMALTALLVLPVIPGCRPASNGDTTGTGGDIEVGDGGVIESPDRDRAVDYLQRLTQVETVEEERVVVSEFAAWLNANGYKLEIDESDGRHTLACPYFPPVTPWTEHDFLDEGHIDLLPRLERD